MFHTTPEVFWNFLYQSWDEIPFLASLRHWAEACVLVADQALQVQETNNWRCYFAHKITSLGWMFPDFFCLAGCGLVGPNASGWYQRESGLGPGEGPQIPPGDGVRSESQRIRKSEWQIPSERSCIQEESVVFTWYSRVRVRFIETWGFQPFHKNVCR